MRRRLITIAALLAYSLLSCAAVAEDDGASRKTLETMRQNAATLNVVRQDAPDAETRLKLEPIPILRYSDAGGITTDASIWIWGDRGRPPVVAGVFFLTQEDREPKWSCELLSLSDGPIAVSSPAGWKWTPPSGNLKWLPLDDEPADSDRQRLRQMKEIAARYEITTFQGSIKSQLRLMVQPLYRYRDPENGLVDGGLFSFAAGTNPEALLMVECRKDDRASAWQVAFARFGANAAEVRRAGDVVDKWPGVREWIATEPYYSRFGLVEDVFDQADREPSRQQAP